jgi:hypothetical protein
VIDLLRAGFRPQSRKHAVPEAMAKLAVRAQTQFCRSVHIRINIPHSPIFFPTPLRGVRLKIKGKV